VSKQQQSIAWPRVPLSEVLTQVSDPHVVKADHEYPNFGIFSFGRGLFPKRPILGIETRATVLYKVSAGQFIYSRLFAFEGAYGLVTTEYDGWFVSNEYPVFDCDETRLLPAYLAAYFRMPSVWHEAARLSTGLGDRRRRVQPTQFLTCSIPLPPLPEQQQIVAKVERMVEKVQEAIAVHEKSSDEVSSLTSSVMNEMWRATRDWSESPLGELVTAVSGQVMPTVEPYASLPHINGESMESGTGRLLPTYRSAKADGVISGKYHFRGGSVLYSKIRPYLRKAVVVPFEGLCSADVYAFDTINPKMQPAFLKYALIAPDFTEYACRVSGRTRMPKLNQKQLFSYSMRFPPLSEQARIVTYLDGLHGQVDCIKTFQSRSAAELDALLPSILDKAFKGELE
jgi:type I restriction enzyme S subunit